VQLWPGLSDPRLSRLELLRRIRAAAEVSGDQEEELAAVEDLLASVDRNRAPLVAAELLVRRTRLRQVTGREFAGLDDVREAVRLSAGNPDSAEHALAVAHLAHVELRHDLPSGPNTAAEAVRLARVSGSKKALAHALTAQVMAWASLSADDEILYEGIALAEEAQVAAAEIRDFWAYTHATHWAANCIDRDSSPAVLDVLRRGREEMTALGGPHTYISVLAADEAAGLLFRGDWRDCVERLRIVLGSTPGAMAATLARLTAAMLAGWQGRPAEAQAHLARADELFLEHSGFLGLEFDAARAEVTLATGDTQAAITAAMAGVGGPRQQSERLLPLAARALSDQIQASQDRGHDVTAALERLSDLRRRFPDIIAEPGPGRLQRLYKQAMQALYDAEVLRGQADQAAAAAWCDAAQACADAESPWDEAYARRRAAEVLLKDRSARAQGAAQLRRAHELAVELDAAPQLAEVEALARTARVSLTVPHAVPADTVTTLPDLTSREREIIAYLVAGRTYAEIARELVISEKTVSVHVSNMLHKTGASNRVELAGLARRLTPRP
jgi:DNA-binding CsgD family transcriptional regulator